MSFTLGVCIGGALAVVALCIINVAAPLTLGCRSFPIMSLNRRANEENLSEDASKESRTTEEALAQYKSLIDNMAAAVILHNSSGEVVWCSPYTEVLTGFSFSEIYGSRKTFLEKNIYEEDVCNFRDACSLVASGESYQYRYRFRHKSGILLWLETRVVPVHDEQRAGCMSLSISIDVTASVHSQAKLEDRNRDLNDFTYMISHDLKAPILTLQGMVALVEEELAPESEFPVAVSIGHMKRAISRLESLVSGILELAQVSAYDSQNKGVPLTNVLGAVVEDYKLDVARVGGHVHIADELPAVYGNEKFLYHIFANLLGNAIKYRHSTRALAVTVTSEYCPSRKRFLIRFKDNGRGIAEEFHKEVFKPFVRVKGHEQKGSGVGLATVSRLVQKISGRIYVESGEEGATFVVELRRPL